MQEISKIDPGTGSKIPSDYHLKRMLKSGDPMDFFGHLEGFVQQSWIQGSFSLQRRMVHWFDISGKLLTTATS